MKIVFSDVKNVFQETRENMKVFNPDLKLRSCIGCFGCWVKTPGECVIKDGINKLGETLGRGTELIVISHCLYGSFSPMVKNLFDRSIPYISPMFEITHNEMHHKKRYGNTLKMSVYFYGAGLSEQEKKLSTSLVHSSALNLHANVSQINYFENIDQLKEALS